MFVFCIESSHARGMGHLYRSLTLADALVRMGEDVHFLINAHEPSLQILKSRGHAHATVDLAPEAGGWETEAVRRLRASAWINDRLDTTAAHVGRVKAMGLPVVTFDDRGSGAAQSDLNVAALVFDPEEVARLQGVRVLTGVDHLVLNPAIARFRRARAQLGSVLVTLGGADTYGATVKVVRLLQDQPWQVTVVLGPAFAHHEALAEVMPRHFEVRHGVASMAEEMARHDLAVTGGGMTPFEANAAGLPCLVVANELFEIPVGQTLERMGGCRFAGHHAAINASVFRLPLDIAGMSTRAMASVGLDGVQRVATAVRELVRP
ncbi:glycosyl transferase [Hylemonella gracilis]|uniref:Glycosyl transferase n=2 Tax=Hylemonella gracilis TaxID=80880 RepID=A0A4P6UHM1_9BURK|nr:glycosyl transferase [Hylemonella gracilis]